MAAFRGLYKAQIWPFVSYTSSQGQHSGQYARRGQLLLTLSQDAHHFINPWAWTRASCQSKSHCLLEPYLAICPSAMSARKSSHWLDTASLPQVHFSRESKLAQVKPEILIFLDGFNQIGLRHHHVSLSSTCQKLSVWLQVSREINGDAIETIGIVLYSVAWPVVPATIWWSLSQILME